jgi:hypothetical protein
VREKGHGAAAQAAAQKALGLPQPQSVCIAHPEPPATSGCVHLLSKGAGLLYSRAVHHVIIAATPKGNWTTTFCHADSRVYLLYGPQRQRKRYPHINMCNKSASDVACRSCTATWGPEPIARRQQTGRPQSYRRECRRARVRRCTQANQASAHQSRARRHPCTHLSSLLQCVQV